MGYCFPHELHPASPFRIVGRPTEVGVGPGAVALYSIVGGAPGSMQALASGSPAGVERPVVHLIDNTDISL